jgi:hypothetical protein
MKFLFIVLLAFINALSASPEILPQGMPNTISDNNGLYKQEDRIATILSGSQGITVDERLAYAALCEKEAASIPLSSSGVRLYQRIGDIYYELDVVRYANKWGKWYRKAIAVVPSLKKDTPIGYRLEEYSKIRLRKNLVFCSFFIYGLMLVFLLIRIFPNPGAFDFRYFIKKTAVFLLLFAVLSFIVFAADSFFFSRTIRVISNEKITTNPDLFPGAILSPVIPYVKPLVPLRMMDFEPAPNAAIILLLGFLPAIIAVFYVSFKKPYNKLLLSSSIVVFILFLWMHYFLVTGTDMMFHPGIAITKSRVLYRGEPEKLLVENPLKALRANPDLLKTDNEDLKEFIKNEFPDGFPHDKQ